MPRRDAQDILTRSSNSSCLTHCELAVYVQTVGKLSATDPCSFYWKLICGVLLLADEHIAWTCTVGDEISSSAAGHQCRVCLLMQGEAACRRPQSFLRKDHGSVSTTEVVSTQDAWRAVWRTTHFSIQLLISRCVPSKPVSQLV